jgi:hypothetical protein
LHHVFVGFGFRFAREPVIKVGALSPVRYRRSNQQEQSGAANLFGYANPQSAMGPQRYCD